MAEKKRKVLSRLTTSDGKYTIETMQSYEISKSLEKMLIQGGMIALIAFLTYLTQTGLPQLTLDFPEYAAIIAGASALVAFVINWLKNHNNIITIQKDNTTGETVQISKNY